MPSLKSQIPQAQPKSAVPSLLEERCRWEQEEEKETNNNPPAQNTKVPNECKLPLKCKTQQKQPVMRDLTYIRLRCVKKISPPPRPKGPPPPHCAPLVVVVPSLQRSVLVTNAYNQITHKNKKASNTTRDLEDSSSSFSSSQMYVITKDFDQENLDPNHMRKI